jgi:hypothetical protein
MLTLTDHVKPLAPDALSAFPIDDPKFDGKRRLFV